ncbi:MAG: HAD family hydrolase [Candidatus Lindowbacteria bacterium]|nr:HAD family hydrolase [Candidatus Lindowbacteria bacterium]
MTAIDAKNNEWGTSYVSPTTEEILKVVGRPVVELFAMLFPEMPEEHRDAIAGRVLEELAVSIRAKKGSIYDDVPEILNTLKAQGYVLFLVSNCRRLYLEAIQETYGFSQWFDKTCCNEDDPVLGKSGLLREFVNGRKGVMIGDRSSDGDAARAADVDWVGCDYGHADSEAGAEISRNELKGADVVVQSVCEIPTAVSKLLNAN